MSTEIKEYIVTTFSENQIGVLNRITAIYLRRKINIESLRVSESSIKGISMFIISAYTSQEIIEKVVKQINRIIEVLDSQYYTAKELITQEIALYKISKSFFDTPDSFDTISSNKGARVIEMRDNYVVVEVAGSREDIELLAENLKEKGVLEQFTRSGSVVLHREKIENILQDKI
ncbi:MAG: acetolactate synthase small subunit [Rikenellaceae bacterium]